MQSQWQLLAEKRKILADESRFVRIIAACQYIHILILSELMCFEDVIINLIGGQRQAKYGMSKIACHIDYYKVTSSIR